MVFGYYDGKTFANNDKSSKFHIGFSKSDGSDYLKIEHNGSKPLDMLKTSIIAASFNAFDDGYQYVIQIQITRTPKICYPSETDKDPYVEYNNVFFVMFVGVFEKGNPCPEQNYRSVVRSPNVVIGKDSTILDKGYYILEFDYSQKKLRADYDTNVTNEYASYDKTIMFGSDLTKSMNDLIELDWRVLGFSYRSDGIPPMARFCLGSDPGSMTLLTSGVRSFEDCYHAKGDMEDCLPYLQAYCDEVGNINSPDQCYCANSVFLKKDSGIPTINPLCADALCMGRQEHSGIYISEALRKQAEEGKCPDVTICSAFDDMTAEQIAMMGNDICIQCGGEMSTGMCSRKGGDDSGEKKKKSYTYIFIAMITIVVFIVLLMIARGGRQKEIVVPRGYRN